MTAIHHFWLGAAPYSAVVVSGLFPAYVDDGVAPALGVSYGSLVGLQKPVDGLSAACVVSYATLESVMAGAGALDGMTCGLGIGQCTLSNGTQAHTPSPDGVAPALAVASASLVSQLVSTTYPAEAAQVGLSITSGTLT